MRQRDYRKAELTLHLANGQSQALVSAALAELAIALGPWTEARSHISHAFELEAGASCPQLAGYLHLRATIEAHDHEFRKASSDLERAIGLLEASAGPQARILASLLDERARILIRLGSRREARVARTQARAIRHYVQNQ